MNHSSASRVECGVFGACFREHSPTIRRQAKQEKTGGVIYIIRAQLHNKRMYMPNTRQVIVVLAFFLSNTSERTAR